MASALPPPDEVLLATAIDRLRAQSRIEYRGEFGPEITTFIPFAAWLKREGHLSGRRVVTYAGMRPYYYFLAGSEFEERNEARHWVPERERDWPSNSTYTALANPWHVYPDYRQRYRDAGRAFERPVLFIQNKFAVEWGEGPINYLPLDSLRRLLELTADRFDVVYSRPRANASGYSADDAACCDYPDHAVVRQFPNVIDFEAECRHSGANYNQAKLEVLAKTHLFVAVQGGGAHVLACFGDSVLLLLHTTGSEYPHAYQRGPYKYLSARPPKLLVAQNTSEFKSAVEIVGRAIVRESTLLLPAAAVDIVKKLAL
ncbi:MAG TPA: hypothetical protein VFR41_13525 [Acidimicrobiia bacterium]|nr:hypothetical protein [Acidimicrobiia bacterium]